MSNINAKNIISDNITVTNLNVTYINGVKYEANRCGNCNKGYYVPCPDCDYAGPDVCDCGEPCDSHEPDVCDCFVPCGGGIGPTGPTGQSNQTASSINITDVNTNAIFYPTFVAGSGNQSLLADITTSPLTYNPSTAVMSFNAPPISSDNATGTGQLVRWDNFTSPISYNPVLTDSGGNNLNSGNYVVRVGRYIQIGNLVWFQVRIQISGKGGLGLTVNDIRITLPTTSSNITDLAQSISIGNITSMTTSIVSAFGQIPAGSGINYFVIPIKTGASVVTMTARVGDISTTFQIRAGGFYFA
jgi:hypothetical protein